MESVMNTQAPEQFSSENCLAAEFPELGENCPLQENRKEKVSHRGKGNRPKWQSVPLDSIVHINNIRENRNPTGRRARRGNHGGSRRGNRRANYIQHEGPVMTAKEFCYSPQPIFYGTLSPTQLEDLKRGIARQIDYYFSEENLINDNYLTVLLSKNGFVEVTEVANFNQMRLMSQDINLIVEAVRYCRNVALDVTRTKVRRAEYSLVAGSTLNISAAPYVPREPPLT